MIIVRNAIDYKKPIPDNEVVFFTSNSTLNNKGELVMGAGNALAMKEAYPQAPKMFADMVKLYPSRRIHITNPSLCGGMIGSFQTKIHWRNPTPLNILMESIRQLNIISMLYTKITYHLPCPAINHGGMKEEDVLKLLDELPNNVLVYIKPNN